MAAKFEVRARNDKREKFCSSLVFFCFGEKTLFLGNRSTKNENYDCEKYIHSYNLLSILETFCLFLIEIVEPSCSFRTENYALLYHSAHVRKIRLFVFEKSQVQKTFPPIRTVFFRFHRIYFCQGILRHRR